MSEAGRVETEYPEKLSFSNSQTLNSINTSPKRRIKTLNILSDNYVKRGAMPLATKSTNRKRERTGDGENAENGVKKWKVRPTYGFSNLNSGFDYIYGIYSFLLVQHCQSTCYELGLTVEIYLQTSSCLIIPDRGILASVLGKLGLVHISTNTTCTWASHHGPHKIRGFCEMKAKGKVTPRNG